MCPSNTKAKPPGLRAQRRPKHRHPSIKTLYHQNHRQVDGLRAQIPIAIFEKPKVNHPNDDPRRTYNFLLVAFRFCFCLSRSFFWCFWGYVFQASLKRTTQRTTLATQSTGLLVGASEQKGEKISGEMLSKFKIKSV